MEYHHVRVTQKSDRSPDEVKLDLTREELEERFLAPYRKGLPIVIGGKSIQKDDLERIRINKTDQDSNHVAKVVEEERRRRIVNGILDIGGPSTAERIASKGEDVTDEFITGPPGYQANESNNPEQHARSSTSMSIFISHSSNDVEIAALLVELLRKALHLSSEDIRCTSVDGYRMQAGATINERLRAEVHDAELLIGLITPHSLASAYVIFELGARWGAGTPMIPLLAFGVTPGHLEGPLAGINALDSQDDGQVYQLLEDAAGYLQVTLDRPSSYAAAVNELVKLSSESTAIEEHPSSNTVSPQLSEETKELLLQAAKNTAGEIIRVRSAGGLVIQAGGKSFVESGDKRSEARWNGALEELLNYGLVNDPTGKGQLFDVTREGFEVADELGASE